MARLGGFGAPSGSPLTLYPTSSLSFDATFKEFYDNALGSMVSNAIPLLKWIKSEGGVRKVKPQGKYVVFATEIRDGSGAGFRIEDDTVPAADKVVAVQGKVPIDRGMKGRIGLSLEAMKMGKAGAGAFATS